MSFPKKVFGALPSTSQNVFKVKFSQPLSSVPSLRAFDNDQTFPDTGNLTTAAYSIFTAGSMSRSMLRCVDTTRAGPNSTGWYLSPSATTGAVATVQMKGNTDYLQFRYTAASMVAGASLLWSGLLLVPDSVNPTFSRLHDLAVRYTFTSTIPVVVFYANSETGGGTNATPVWATVGTASGATLSGIRFGSATATNTNILANIPLSGVEVTKTAWIATS